MERIGQVVKGVVKYPRNQQFPLEDCNKIQRGRRLSVVLLLKCVDPFRGLHHGADGDSVVREQLGKYMGAHKAVRAC
jgi:hypothetical protein